MSFQPNWGKVCDTPDAPGHGWFHVWIDCGGGFHRYWCKYCGLFGRGEVWADERQLELPLE